MLNARLAIGMEAIYCLCKAAHCLQARQAQATIWWVLHVPVFDCTLLLELPSLHPEASCHRCRWHIDACKLHIYSEAACMHQSAQVNFIHAAMQVTMALDGRYLAYP